MDGGLVNARLVSARTWRDKSGAITSFMSRRPGLLVTLSYFAVLAEVRSAHGKAPDLAIEIRHVREVAVAGPLLVAAYEEWQHGRGRLATVVLRQDQGGLSWLHLQETWIEPPDA